MGAGASKDELVYMAVQRGDANGIRALRQQGASLEWRDAKGRTPLMLACSRPEAFQAAHVLLQLGANINAASKGVDGGTPIHFAARKRLTRTLEMLLNYGADPLLRNDVGKSALDIARDLNNGQMVRLIESRVALFASNMSQHFLSNAILKMLVPQWVSREVWVAVLPVAKGAKQYQLAIHADYGTGTAMQLINLQGHLIVLTKQDTPDPKVVIQNSTTGEKFKFGAARPPNHVLVTNFYNACIGIPVVQNGAQPAPAAPAAAAVPPPPPPAGAPTAAPAAAAAAAKPAGKVAADAKASSRLESFQGPDMDDDVALKLAIEESKKTASARAGAGADYNGWGGAAGQPSQPTYGGWGADEPAAPAAAVGAAAAGAAAAAAAGAGAAGRQGRQAGSQAGPQPAAASAPALPQRPAAPAAVAPVAPAPPPPRPSAPTTGAPPPVGVGVEWPAPAQPAAAASALGASGASEAPSAPPMPSSSLYPTIDTSPVTIDYGSVDLLSAAAPAARSPEPTPVVNPAYSEERVKAELKKAESKKGEGQCVICWDAPAEAVCVPCGHIAGCMECLNEVKTKEWGCPVCRAKIETVIKVFQV